MKTARVLTMGAFGLLLAACAAPPWQSAECPAVGRVLTPYELKFAALEAVNGNRNLREFLGWGADALSYVELVQLLAHGPGCCELGKVGESEILPVDIWSVLEGEGRYTVSVRSLRQTDAYTYVFLDRCGETYRR